jgi:hypothetical protein
MALCMGVDLRPFATRFYLAQASYFDHSFHP